MIGLRGRFVAAMALVSAVTLGVTALALFSPLEQRLRSDVLDGMVRAVHADRRAFAHLGTDRLTVSSVSLHRVVKSLRRGSGADVAVVGPDGRLLYSTDADDLRASPATLKALRSGQEQRGESGPSDERVAEIVVPLTVEGSRVAVALSRPLDSVSSGVRVVQDAFLLAAAISLLVALLVGTILSRRLVRRLRSLRDTALRVAELGPVAEMRGDETADEVGDLTRALATMQERLREQERARRAFVATASHELRTPLTSLTVILDTLRRDLEAEHLDVDSARVGAQGAEAQAVRLSGLTSELLDLSRVDAGQALRSEPVSLTEVARSVAAEFEVHLDIDQRRINVDVDGELRAQGDPGAAARIVRILLDNALRHAPTGRVEVRCEACDGGVSVRVHDHGPGVIASDRERIFDRFCRGETPEVPGFGLGLAIARELARQMHGDVDLDSRRVGPRGATFVLVLPAAHEPSFRTDTVSARTP